ncbi:MAG: magnesium transporter [Oscillospiraceae bacterium]|nr:magnesium transporter [Oscillospiraceae bacterium]MBR4093409.1 magnesium transporter [Oscillospiraceae bacterium]
MGDNYKGFSVTIEKLLEEKKYASLRDILTTINPADIALIFAEIPEEKLPLLFRLLPKELAAEAFVEMDEDMQEHLIKGFSDAELKAVVDELYVDDAVDIVEEMPANVVKRLLKQADPELRKMINEILKYPEDSAGSIMTTEYLSLRPQMTVEEAIKRIRRTCVDKETIYTCYVTDQNRTLIGMLSLKDLLVADDDDIVENIMETNVICVETHTDQEEVAQSLSKYNFMALPVVDKETRLVGIVTFDDAIDVIEEETTEDIEMMAAITPTDKPYLKTSVFEIWKKRIPWLLLLMISATFTTLIISSFESALAAQLVLTSFIPMIMGTGGNSGSQSSVTIIRGLSLDEIEFSDILKVIWKETRVAILCGLTLAVANFFKLILFEGVEVNISLTISLTLLITVLVAKVIGSSLPMLAKKIGFDPAVMASPLITTMVDALSLLVYFTTATALLNL